MRYRTLDSTGFVLCYKISFNLHAETKFIKQCLDYLWKDVIPTILMLICSSIFTLYLCELIDQAKIHTMDLKPAHASHNQPLASKT